ncbi:hypothetical protein PISMIDRAFT_532515 [Pisolithus microcarpus 441]|uniref:Uncharacterized protein n=1 Tax=Pisolithus microcarpus 441 TaxID=765257 RepID=A0A0C9YB29_9AGAM|nr:hypothetical protein PISMIDRAFT_532515 [Pisolithus microcarpus 441]
MPGSKARVLMELPGYGFMVPVPAVRLFMINVRYDPYALSSAGEFDIRRDLSIRAAHCHTETTRA